MDCLSIRLWLGADLDGTRHIRDEPAHHLPPRAAEVLLPLLVAETGLSEIAHEHRCGPPAAESLRLARWGFLTAITGLDDVKANEIEVLYHFVNGSPNVNLRVRIPRDNAAIPSICSICPGATFFERELSEMFGITVMGTPNPDRLFLPDQWPTDAPPLRKDFVMPQLQ